LFDEMGVILLARYADGDEAWRWEQAALALNQLSTDKK
jgi:hypothetical protein